MKTNSIKLVFVQRVITSYRLELLKLLCNHFSEVGIITSRGNKMGTLKVAKYKETISEISNLTIHELPSYKIGYKGESRSTNFFLYPKAISIIKKYDVIIFEGTTNLINNLYLIPYAKLLGKKTIWWDAGYSLPKRSLKRKIIDNTVKPLIKLTDIQMAYSSLAKDYMSKYMGAKQVFLNLNTINTSYFEQISDEINRSLDNYKFKKNNIKLLYVGVIESRKKVKELIEIVLNLNELQESKQYNLTVIGGGNQLNELQDFTKKYINIQVLGPIYDKEKLKEYYFNSDLFVLPGDGGLAILQSILFGLPVLSIVGADGTELDYIPKKEYLAKDLNEISEFLKKLENIDRKLFINQVQNLSSSFWIDNLITQIKKIPS